MPLRVDMQEGLTALGLPDLCFKLFLALFCFSVHLNIGFLLPTCSFPWFLKEMRREGTGSEGMLQDLLFTQ